ncbi:MAG: histidine kinase N-terminal 7TM domain-containing protein [Halorhabdus sp.]
MVFQLIFVALVLTASVFAAAIVAWLGDHEEDLSRRLFVLIAGLQSIGGVIVVAQLVAGTRALSVGLYGLEHATLALVTPAFFLFVLVLLGYRRHVTRPVLVFVFGVFFLTGLLQVTNPVHGLFWRTYTVVEAPFAYVVGVPTDVSFVLMLPQMTVYYVGMGLLGVRAIFGSGTQQRQAVALFVGFLPPFVVTSVWSIGALPGPIAGWSVIGGTWSLAVVSWAVFRHQLFDVVPVARETVFESLTEMVIVVDSQRRILDANAAAIASFTELSTADGATLDSVLPELVGTNEDRSSDMGGHADASISAPVETINTGKDPFVDSFRRHVGDEPRDYSVTATPITVGDVTSGYAVVIRDVTERRQRIQNLEQQTAQLERFAETLSHDLRNPLSVARGRIDLAQETGEVAQLRTAADALERIERLIDDTLTLARQGQAIADREPVDITQLARTAWKTTDTDRTTFEIEPDAAITVYADASRLRTVFENLFRNAVEHGSTPDSRQDAAEGQTNDSASTGAGWSGSEDETARTRQSSEPLMRGGSETTAEHQHTVAEARLTGDAGEGPPGCTVRLGRTKNGFYVEDDGPGIPPTEREDVFEYGYTTDEDGTGLGLAIVDAIANAHGWSVAVTDGREGGARIVFEGVDVVEPSTYGD